jgi:hypothetical protein
MSNNSLPAHLRVRLNQLRSDPEVKELLEAMGKVPQWRPPLQRFSPSLTADSQQQLNRFIHQSGFEAGWEMLVRVLTTPERETQ